MVLSFDHFDGNILDSFQHVHIFHVTQGSELETAQIWLCQDKTQVKNHLFCPAGNNFSNAVQDIISL